MRGRGFTLIELLIVVAIIAILALIAVPNFLEAQVRSKISRSRADIQTAAKALEAYAVDHNGYPPMNDRPHDIVTGFHSRLPSYLTTPIAYISSLPYDPFMSWDKSWQSELYPKQTRVGERYVYYNVELLLGHEEWGASWAEHQLDSRAGAWVLYGSGPDRDPFNWGARTMTPYDPTNGTVSAGNIIRTQRFVENIAPRADGSW